MTELTHGLPSPNLVGRSENDGKLTLMADKKTARIAHFFYEFLQRQLGVEIGLPQAVDGDIAKQLVQFVHFALILRSFFAGPARLSLLAQSNLNQTIKPRRDALGAMDRPGRVEVNDL